MLPFAPKLLPGRKLIRLVGLSDVPGVFGREPGVGDVPRGKPDRRDRRDALGVGEGEGGG